MSDTQLKLIESLWRVFQRERSADPDLSVTVFASSYPDVEQRIVKLFPMLNELKDFAANPIPCPEKIGDYSVVRQIGIGGMGVVYEAENETIQQRVAIKIVEPSLINGRNVRQLEKEARLAASLHHSNIVPVFEFGEFEQNYFYTMKYIDGPNLSEVLHLERSDLGDELSTSEQHLVACAERLACNWEMQIQLVKQIADAIRYAHSNGVLHRDVKPANVLLDEKYKVWITDFGLAKLRVDEQRLTVKSKVMGTPRYMAPEQIRGEADERSDVFGLGLCFYEMAVLRTDLETGRKPIWKGGLQPPSHYNVLVPQEVESIIMKAVSLDPNQRQQSMDEFISELEQICLLPVRPATTIAEASGSRRSLVPVSWLLFLAALLVFAVLLGPKLWTTNSITNETVAEIEAKPTTVHTRQIHVIECEGVVAELDRATIGFEPGNMHLRGSDAQHFAIDSKNRLVSVSKLAPNIAKDANQDNRYEISIIDLGNNHECHLVVKMSSKNNPPTFNERIFSGKNGSLVIQEAKSVFPTKIEVNNQNTSDHEDVVFSITGGVDRGRFAITPNGALAFTSQISFDQPIDENRDNLYEVELKIMDRSLASYARIENNDGQLSIVQHQLQDDATLSRETLVDDFEVSLDVIDFCTFDGKNFYHLHRDGIGTVALCLTEVDPFSRQTATRLLNRDCGITQQAIGFGCLDRSNFVVLVVDNEQNVVMRPANLNSRYSFEFGRDDQIIAVPNNISGFSWLDEDRFQFVSPEIADRGRFFFAFLSSNPFAKMPLGQEADFERNTLGQAAWISREEDSLATVRSICVEVIE